MTYAPKSSDKAGEEKKESLKVAGEGLPVDLV